MQTKNKKKLNIDYWGSSIGIYLEKGQTIQSYYLGFVIIKKEKLIQKISRSTGLFPFECKASMDQFLKHFIETKNKILKTLYSNTYKCHGLFRDTE